MALFILEIPKIFLFVCLFCIVSCLVAILIIKAINILLLRKSMTYTKQLEPYLNYVETCLVEEIGEIRPFPNQLYGLKRKILQQRMIELIETLKGSQRDRLIQLCIKNKLIEHEISRLKSFIHWKRIDAAYNLGCMRSYEALPGLFQLFRKENKDLQPTLYVIARAIAKCAKTLDDIQVLLTLLVQHRKETHQLLVDIIEESSLELLHLYEKLLKSEDLDLKKIALIGLTRNINPGLESSLNQLVDDENKDIRIKAVKAIMKMNHILSDEMIEAMLLHPDWEIRAAVAKSLGTMGSSRYISMLKQSMKDLNWWVRYNSANSLTALQEEGFEALCQVAVDGDDRFQVDMATDMVHNMLNNLSLNKEDFVTLLEYNKYLYLYQKYFSTKISSKYGIITGGSR